MLSSGENAFAIRWKMDEKYGYNIDQAEGPLGPETWGHHCRIKGFIGDFLGDWGFVGILGAARVDRYVPTGLNDAVQGASVDDQVFDNR